MLIGISIRNLVLIDRLDLEVEPGLSVLTGETGAGKSILLDALGLATGARADSSMIRKGCDQATAIAEFIIPKNHETRSLLSDHGIEADDRLILRRVISRDGRGRAFANDQAISAGLLRNLGGLLVEVHGQHDERGLLNAASHRTLLDGFGGLANEVRACREAYRNLAKFQDTLNQVRADLQRARVEEDYLRHALNELDELSPMADEEASLAASRALMMNSEKLAAEMNEAMLLLSGASNGGAETSLAAVLTRLERVAKTAAGKLDPAISAVGRALSETMEARAQLELLFAEMQFQPQVLEAAEARLMSLRAVARKHHVSADGLPELRERFASKLALLDAGGEQLEGLERDCVNARKQYDAVAGRLSEARRACAVKLDKAVTRELVPLKLDKALFRTVLHRLPGDDVGPDGIDRVEFQIATNPGADPGPLVKIASGGELSRFLLALKVVLAKSASTGTLVFDEIDSAVGGAVADAIGDRLAKLSSGAQIMVVTHSPQVAARGNSHWRISKKLVAGGSTTTSVEVLDAPAKREEIARMLAGAKVTDAARAAADSLMASARP